MGWKSDREVLRKAFDYAKENKNVSPRELSEKFAITEGESTIIIGYLSFGRFDAFYEPGKKRS